MPTSVFQPKNFQPTGDAPTDFKVIGLIGTAHFFSHFYIYLLPPLFPVLKIVLDVSYAELGLLLAVFSATTGLTQIPFGFLVDRFGARLILIGGLAIEGTAFLLMGFADGYWILMSLMVRHGLLNLKFMREEEVLDISKIHLMAKVVFKLLKIKKKF